ncbi:hypothetical protein [Burkholderia pyrrocinia]|uniref:hypothetical protein n=1 Tax=Burkholderia pyrrocinia TaxID=60550 RepID=UPI001BCB8ED5|nr:hypothetical protein [Burkholderia pyrrocinia]QVN23002.1 hypothetical protein JYG32_36825 [Burkholderia pyrrocinia]
MFVATSKMVASLLGATSFQCVDDIDAYVGSLEAIVFGLIARHVKFDIRAQARSAYGDGIRAGLFGSDGLIGPSGELEVSCLDDSDAFLNEIRLAGQAHGQSIRYWMEAQRNLEKRAPEETGDMGDRSVAGTFL